MQKLTRRGMFLLFWGGVVGVILGLTVVFSGGELHDTTLPFQQSPQTIAMGKPVIGFELTSISDQPVRLADFRGRPVMINFWGYWCPPCKVEMPMFEAVYQKLQADLTIVGVNVGDREEVVKKYVRESQLTFPIVLDRSRKVSSMYLINAYPTTFFVDAEGILRDRHIGLLDEELLKDYLLKIGVNLQ